MRRQFVVNNSTELPKTIFRFIWHFLSKFKVAVSFYVFLSMIAGLWGPFNSILIKNVINLLPKVQGGDASILLIPVGLIVLNFLVFDNVTWRSITYIRAKFTPVIINNMIGSSMSYVLGHSHQFFQDNLSGKISKQITNLADGTEKLITSVCGIELHHMLRKGQHIHTANQTVFEQFYALAG